MIDQLALHRTLYRLGFALIAILVAFQKLLPLDFSPEKWPEPDIVLLFAFAWVLRRPGYIPVLLAATVFLFNDLLLFRPPGLWAAVCVIGLEFLRSRANTLLGQPFVFEWIMVSAVIAISVLTDRLISGLFLVPQASLSADIVFIVGNMIVYPIVVLVSIFVMRVRPGILGDDRSADQVS